MDLSDSENESISDYIDEPSTSTSQPRKRRKRKRIVPINSTERTRKYKQNLWDNETPEQREQRLERHRHQSAQLRSHQSSVEKDIDRRTNALQHRLHRKAFSGSPRAIQIQNENAEQHKEIRDYEAAQERRRRALALPQSSHYLGSQNNQCQYCGALHFAGDFVCCGKGRIFLDPPQKLPPLLDSLLFDYSNPDRYRFREDILMYNSKLALASMQYDHLRQNPFGIMSMKVRGPIRHMPSCIRPNNPNNPNFGNFYIYDVQAAMDFRMADQVNKPRPLNRNLLQQLAEMVAQFNPYASCYKHMDELMQEQEAAGHSKEVSKMRLKLIDAHGIDPDLLMAHPGVYDAPRCGNMIAAYYTCDVEQHIPKRGFKIYPRLDNHVPFEIKYYCRMIDALCYPLLNIYGEDTWQPDIPYVDHMNYIDRMQSVKQRMLKDGKEIDWSIEIENKQLLPQGVHEQIGEILALIPHTSPELDPESDSSEEENETDEYLEFVAPTEDSPIFDLNDNKVEELIFVEHNGDVYPHRQVVNPDSSNRYLGDEFSSSEDDSDSNVDEFDTHNISDELAHQMEEDDAELAALLSPSADLINEMNEDNASETFIQQPSTSAEKIRKRKTISLREWILFRCQHRKGWRNRIHSSRRLGQLYVIDILMRIAQQVGKGIQDHFTQTTRTTKQGFLNYMNNLALRQNSRVGAVCVVPQHIPGSPRYLRNLFERAVTLSNRLGHPDLFITFTASKDWKELKENIPKGSLITPILSLKYLKKKNPETRQRRHEQHKQQLFKGGHFGDVSWYVYSIEFQQRGLPHAHIVISLAEHNKPRTPADIDSIAQAEFPTIPDISDPDYKKYAIK
ncbi:hypothetical protein L596_021462 [Steinernema carpocapsae]|uniref:Helitron helicase-like domain-containing protein n=1 Tax=Steinernema carpocapsae TaxID=34508 RepID=A0A4U5MJN0_STECR|nr:hypothetical protein L596_021462 [Steinernema carpocapsae]